MPAGSLVPADDALAETLAHSGQLRKIDTFPEPGDPPAFALLQK
jgi:hypothetical protein